MFGIPKKTQDGRYYVKPTEKKFVQLNGVSILSVSHDSITLSIGDAQRVAEVDDMILNESKQNCELWFSRPLSDKTVEAAYTKSFSGGVMNVSKPQYHKAYRSRELIGDESLVDGTVCDVVLELSGISFSKKTFHPVWKIIQTRLKELPKKKYHEEYLFQDDAPDEEVSDDDLFA